MLIKQNVNNELCDNSPLSIIIALHNFNVWHKITNYF